VLIRESQAVSSHLTCITCPFLTSLLSSLSEQGEPSGPGGDVRDDFDDDEDTAKGMARLFAEVGEAYIFLVASAVQEASH
jgi:hypothetical protein